MLYVSNDTTWSECQFLQMFSRKYLIPISHICRVKIYENDECYITNLKGVSPLLDKSINLPMECLVCNNIIIEVSNNLPLIPTLLIDFTLR